MTKLIRLIRKNFHIMLRSRISSLIIIFGPLFLMLLAGFAYNNTDSFTLEVGIYAPGESNLTQRYVNALSENFILIPTTTLDECIIQVQSLQTNGCVAFPEEFEIRDGGTNIIEIHVDNSQITVVDLIQNALNRVIFQESAQISTDLTRVLIISINDVSRKLETWRGNINNQILPSITQSLNDLDAARIQLGAMNLESPSSGNVFSQLSSTATQITRLVENTQDAAKESLSLISSTIDALEAIDSEDSGPQIASIINNLQTKHSSLSSSITANTTVSINNLELTIGEVRDVLDSLENSVNSARSVRGSVNTRLNEIQTKVTSARERLIVLAVEIDVTFRMLENIQIRNETSIVSPVISEIKPVAAQSSKLQYVFPALIILVIMFVSVMLASTMVVLEKVSPAKFRLFTTPASDIWYILSIFITVLLVGIFQSAILLCVGYYIFDLQIFENIANTWYILVLSSVMFTLIGMTLGYLFNNEHTTILASISVGSAFLLVSDIFLPIQNMPDAFQNVIQYTPFVYLTTLLRRTIIFNAEFMHIWQDVLIIGAYCVVLFIVIVSAHKIMKLFFTLSIKKKRKI